MLPTPAAPAAVDGDRLPLMNRADVEALVERSVRAAVEALGGGDQNQVRCFLRAMCVCVCGVVWCGVVWCGVVWCGVVWCGVVWCGVVWCSGERSKPGVLFSVCSVGVRACVCVCVCACVCVGVVWCGLLWFGGVVWCCVVLVW